jgi:two-component system LytT family response regulator
VVVVDDERPARERLRRLLSRDARVEFVDGVAGGADAIEAVRRQAADDRAVQILFLDVQMPEVGGFEVVAALAKLAPQVPLPAIVFVTAHDAYALRAFDAHAVDYLLKPFSDERFQAALDRAIRDVRGRHANAVLGEMQALLGSVGQAGRHTATGSPVVSPAAKLDRIVLKGANRVRLLPVDQITWIEAEGMYVNIHTRDGAVHLHRGLLRTISESLDERRFVRIHRSAVVNIDVVSELRQDAHGDYVAVLRDQTPVRVGRRFRARLQARLGQQI